VKTALATVDGIEGVETSAPGPDGGTCSFNAPADLDVEATLNKLVEGGASKIKGWSKAE
jgi:hypothetical protein